MCHSLLPHCNLDYHKLVQLLLWTSFFVDTKESNFNYLAPLFPSFDMAFYLVFYLLMNMNFQPLVKKLWIFFLCTLKGTHSFLCKDFKGGLHFCFNEEGGTTKTLSARNSIFLARPFLYFMTSPSILFVYQYRKKEVCVHSVDLLLVINITHQTKWNFGKNFLKDWLVDYP